MIVQNKSKFHLQVPDYICSIPLWYTALFLFVNTSLSLPQSNPPFYVGADLSFLQQIESGGSVFKENGTPKDILTILKGHGINTIRLRIWNSPADGWNDLTKTLAMAKRVKNAGLSLLLDFHYSDTWADPGKQTKPAAWQSLSFTSLTDSVSQYTARVILALKAQGTRPQLVQVGNEITCGFLWPDGSVCDTNNTTKHWQNFCTLLKAGIKAVRDNLSADSTAIMIHIDRGGDYSGASWFFDDLNAQGVQYDYIGLSYYPWWHGDLTALTGNISKLASRYGKKIIIAETAYPWTLSWNDGTNNIVGSSSQLLAGYPATPDGQYQFLKNEIALLKQLPSGLGAGVFYWEPDWVASPALGSSWENLALFDFSNNALVGLTAFENLNSIHSDEAVKPGYWIAQNFPNPFNPSTTIRYSLSASTMVSIKVFDVLGRQIALLVNAMQPAGEHEVSFEARQLPSGIYYYTISAAGKQVSKAMVLSK